MPIVVYVDEGVSGGAELDKRPDLARLMREWQPGDVVLFWKLDRLARSMVHFVDIMRLAEKAGVALVSIADNIDLSTDEGKFLAHILATFAEFERSQIRSRTANARRHMIKVGRWTGGRVPYGLKAAPHPDGVGKTLVRDPFAVAIIRRIYELVMGVNHPEGKGLAITTIAASLQAEGVPSPRVHTSTKANPAPAAWSSKAIRVIMESPTVVGHDTDPYTGRVIRGEDGKPVQVWAPALTVEEQAQVLERIGPSVKRAKAGDRHWLYGVAVCGVCGGNMKRTNGGKFQPDVVIFRCRGTLKAPHGNVSVRAEELARWVDAKVLERLGPGQAVKREFVEGTGPAGDLERLKEYLEELEEDRKAGMYSAPGAIERFRQSYAETTRQIAELEANPPTEPGWQLVPTGRTFAEEWAAKPLAERGRYLFDAEASVAVRPPEVKRTVEPLDKRCTLDLGELEDMALELESVVADAME
ncbi:integrase [Streptomyces phage Attoomi]|uniref:Integrase n=1 Tax=Streptomyces phage Attoomi TaxID=2059881 RepID=A0A2H5BLK4_9CAUD|nr:integrase [Streptomyces phage Attoomi]AUG87183.1 integrase [Streptomyces phage Attoomi]